MSNHQQREKGRPPPERASLPRAVLQNLEAQLEQREKQYEYYRNKLLTFE